MFCLSITFSRGPCARCFRAARDRPVPAVRRAKHIERLKTAVRFKHTFKVAPVPFRTHGRRSNDVAVRMRRARFARTTIGRQSPARRRAPRRADATRFQAVRRARPCAGHAGCAPEARRRHGTGHSRKRVPTGRPSPLRSKRNRDDAPRVAPLLQNPSARISPRSLENVGFQQKRFFFSFSIALCVVPMPFESHVSDCANRPSGHRVRLSHVILEPFRTALETLRFFGSGERLNIIHVNFKCMTFVCFAGRFVVLKDT